MVKILNVETLQAPSELLLCNISKPAFLSEFNHLVSANLNLKKISIPLFNIILKSKMLVSSIEEGILEAKTECYAKDKVKSPPLF